MNLANNRLAFIHDSWFVTFGQYDPLSGVMTDPKVKDGKVVQLLGNPIILAAGDDLEGDHIMDT
jgi:hypothetical protein